MRQTTVKRSEQGPTARSKVAGARTVLGLWLLTAMGTLTACLPQTGVMTGACVAGRAEGCDCVGGGRGVQICARDGLSFDGGFRIDLEALEAEITDRTRAVVVVSPNNPTGSFLRAH